MKQPSVWKVLLVAILCALLGACAGTERKRIAPDEERMEDGTGMSSQDFRSVAQRMARSLITVDCIQNVKGEPPTVAFVSVANNSNDPYLDGDAFLNKMRTELIKHAQGRIRFLDREVAKAIDDENRQKARGRLTSSGEKQRLGADLFLTGTIESIDKVAGGGSTTYMRYSFRLTDAANSTIVWEDDYEIKKYEKKGVMY